MLAHKLADFGARNGFVEIVGEDRNGIAETFKELDFLPIPFFADGGETGDGGGDKFGEKFGAFDGKGGKGDAGEVEKGMNFDDGSNHLDALEVGEGVVLQGVAMGRGIFTTKPVHRGEADDESFALLKCFEKICEVVVVEDLKSSVDASGGGHVEGTTVS